MESFTKVQNFCVFLLILVLLLLPPCFMSSTEVHIEEKLPLRTKMLDDHVHHRVLQSTSPQLSLQIVVHGFLLWASMGFLIPVGILTIRFSNREESGRMLRIMFFIHAATQILSVILVIAGAILSVKNFSNTFDNVHRRLGVALYSLVFLQALGGLLRPARGGKRRRLWFYAHWILGTMVSVLGIINVYTGLQAYHRRTSRSIKPWVIFYTAEIVCIGLLYLFQDKQEYIQKQGVVQGNEPTTTIQPTDDQETLAKQNKDSC